MNALLTAITMMAVSAVFIGSLWIAIGGYINGNKRKGIIGLSVFVVTLTFIYYAIISDHEHQRQECEKFGGELRKFSNGYSYSVATKTHREDYEYICVKE